MRKVILCLLFVNLSYAAPDKPYIIGALLGQLGNQLFEVATTCSVAWDNGAECYFPDLKPVAHYPDGAYQNILFRVKIDPPSDEISQEWGALPFGYAPIPYSPKMKLSGYFQNEKYFAHHRDRVIDLFAPRPDHLKYIRDKYGWILAHPESVSVHLRYYYAEKPDEDTFIQYEREYFTKAMALFPKTSLFVVMSDNIEFARRNIPTEGLNVVFIENEPYYIDFYLQSLCKNNIISNSTFSWWSAWLNQNPHRKVVRPEVWLDGYPDIGGPEDWIKVSARGLQAQLKENRQNSHTGSIPTYPEACKRAVDDRVYFENFRSSPEYSPILECGFGGESAQYLQSQASQETLSKIEQFRALDQIGNPTRNDIPGFGSFSGTTLRYVVIADQITKLFDLPQSLSIAEIGAGFGGQAYILSQLRPVKDYFIYDLPEVERLIEKVTKTLSMKGVHLLPHFAPLPEDKVDLVVSNYAFSECDRATQMDYFERVLKKADRGYIIFNQLGHFNSLSSDELVKLLEDNKMNPKVYDEPVFTYEGNVLIVWDRTKAF